jgi:hypothetical protein
MSRTEQRHEPEPPSCRSFPPSPLFLIGRDSHGTWVVQDQQGLCGGLFVSHAEALRFARRQNGNRPTAMVMVSGIFELDLTPRR